MPKETKRRYAINFDLKISNLEKYYSKTNPKGRIKRLPDTWPRMVFLIANGPGIYQTRL